MRLNKEQNTAVQATNGRVLVLAGAGSGKTSVLISRCIHLIKNLNVPPGEILGLTFTNKAATEMRERIAKRLGKALAEELTLSTFHSFCLLVLKQEIHHLGYSNQFSIYDDQDMRRLEQAIERTMQESGKEEIKDEDLQAELLSSLRAYNAVNFDSMLVLTVEIFEKHPEVLSRYQQKYRYVMIDEYQDTNSVQYRLASLLCSSHNNLFVVGDDDQAIYGWRGAEVDHILEFEHQTLVKLEENYRSTQPILDVANALIAKNTMRHEKALWSQNRSGDPVHLFHAPSEMDEAEAVVERINKMRTDKNLNWRDFAILYRSNALARPFEKALLKASWRKDGSYVRGIPYCIVQGTEFYERAEVKDFVSYLKAINNPKDQRALVRILNYPRRGVSIKSVEALTEAKKSRGGTLWDQIEDHASITMSDQGHVGLDSFAALMNQARDKFANGSLKDGMEWLHDKLQMKEVICQEVKSEEAQMYKLDNLQTLIGMGESADEDGLSLNEFLGTMMIDQVKQDKTTGGHDRVNLLTLHSAKGLEFPACFIVGLEDSILPHEKSLAEGNLEEERRLFYVGITRAKKYLTLSMCKKRTSYGKERPTNPSRFLYELPKEQLIIESFDRPARFSY